MRTYISDREAWRLFQIAAISEAVSWLLLLIGIYFQYIAVHRTDVLVAIGGSIHGIVFLAYAAAVLGLWRVLRLTPWQVAVAALASIVPLGTLAFEQWLAGRRQREAYGSYREIVVRGIIADRDKLLLVQPSESAAWSLPGGKITPGEPLEAAVQRTVAAQTGIAPEVGDPVHAAQFGAQLEVWFSIANSQDFRMVDPTRRQFGVDEIGFMDRSALPSWPGRLG